MATQYAVELYARGPDGVWRNNGSYSPLNCFAEPSVKDPREALRAGNLQPTDPEWPDLSFGGTPAQLSDSLRCRRVEDEAR